MKAIARIAKLKGNGLSASALHTSRERDTPNANPDQPNQRIVGRSLEPLEQLVKQRIGEQRIRKDAVLCVELLLSISPEYFRPLEPSRAGYWEEAKLERFQWTVQQWLSQTYGDRIVRAELHLDEATPHIHAYLVPLDERGKLNCKGLFGSREQLRQFQDSYAQALEPLGVERGIRGSRATHTAIQVYYGAVMQEADEMLELEVVQHQLADRRRALKERDELEQTARALERDNAVLRRQVQQQRQTLQELRSRGVDAGRSLSLETVAAELGLATDSQRPYQWQAPGFDININGSRFYDWTVMQGGEGAIDLVMHVEQCGFRQAVVWLRDRFGEAAALRVATELVQEILHAELMQPFELPEADVVQWRTAREYLTQMLRLPGEWVDRWHQQNLVYAQAEGRIVFVHRSIEAAVVKGATLYSIHTGDWAVVAGSRRSQGWFYLDGGDLVGVHPQRVVLLESPIEALSKWVLEQPSQVRSLFLVAELATLSQGHDLRRWLESTPEVVLAVRSDRLEPQLRYELPGMIQEEPTAASWNQDLQSYLGFSRVSQHSQAAPGVPNLEI